MMVSACYDAGLGGVVVEIRNSVPRGMGFHSSHASGIDSFLPIG